MESGWLAGLAPEALREALRRCLTARTTAQEVFEMFEPEGATLQRIPWGGSGNWRALFSTAEGLRAAFEFDAEGRLLAYGVMPVLDRVRTAVESAAALANIPLILTRD